MNRLETLQQQIADGAARRDIELYCKPMAWEDDIVTHYDSVPRDPELAETIAMAVEYLTMRGRLARHVARLDWIRVDVAMDTVKSDPEPHESNDTNSDKFTLITPSGNRYEGTSATQACMKYIKEEKPISALANIKKALQEGVKYDLQIRNGALEEAVVAIDKLPWTCVVDARFPTGGSPPHIRRDEAVEAVRALKFEQEHAA